MNKRSLKAIYDSYAPEYSSLIQKAGWRSPQFVEKILKPHLKKGDHVLDAACGDGYACEKIFDLCEIYGFDHAEKMVKYARKKNYKEVIVHDADETLPYKDNFFDAVVGFGFFEFIKNVHFTLSEFKRVIKENGLILFTVEEFCEELPKQSTKTEKVLNGVFKTRYSQKEMSKFINKLKLEIIEHDRIYGYKSESLGGEYYYHYYLLQKSK